MADLMGNLENQLGDLIEWLLINIEIPIAAVVAALVLFIILLYIALRKRGKKGTRPIIKGDLTLLEKGRIEIPGHMVTLDLQADRMIISLAGPEEEAVEEIPPEEPEDIEPPLAEEKPAEKKMISNLRLASDINTAISIITSKHGLASLTLADSEGLVVASTSDTPEEDAVASATAVASGKGLPGKWIKTGDGSQVTSLLHKGNIIYIHLRTGEPAPEEGLGPIQEDIKFSMAHTLS